MANFFDQFDAPSSSGNFFDQFDEKPEAPKPEGGLIASLKQTGGQLVKSAGQAAADFLPGVTQDNALKSYGQEVIDANPTAVRSLSDVAASPWTATKEAVGNAVGSMGAMVGAQALGKGIEAAAPLAGPARPLVSLLGKGIQLAGPTVTAALPSYGGIREQQMQDDPTRADSPEAKARALAGAGAVGLIETSFGPERWALAATNKAGRAKIIESLAGKSLVGSIGKGMAKGAAVEGAEEVAQNPIEQIAGYQDPTTAANLQDTAFSGVMGALGGGVLGGAGGGVSYAARPEQPKVDPAAGPMSRAAAVAQQTGADTLAQAAGAAQQAQGAEGATQATQPATDPLAELSARLTPQNLRAIRTAEGYGPESVDEVLHAYQIARNPQIDPTLRQQATEALNSFWQGFDNRPNWTTPNPQAEQPAQPGTDVVPFGARGTDVATLGVVPPFDPNTLEGNATEIAGTLPGAPRQLVGPEKRFLDAPDRMQAKRAADAEYEQAYQDLVKAEQLGASDRDLLAYQQALRDKAAVRDELAADLADTDARVAGSMEQQAVEGRRSLLDTILNDPETKNPLPRFESALKKAGYAQRRASPEERQAIERFQSAREAFAEPDRIAAAPNEMDASAMGIRERQPKVRQPESKPRAAFPMSLEGAQRRADAKTAATGTPHEVVPHPTLANRFIVQPVAQTAQIAPDSTSTLAQPVATANTSPERVAQAPENVQVAPLNIKEVQRNTDTDSGTQSVEYRFGDGAGSAMVRIEGAHAHLSDIQLGEQEGAERGKGVGTRAYEQLGRQLAAEGVTLQSTRWGSHQAAISPAALRVWEKLAAAGLARQTGAEVGKVADRFTGQTEVREIPTYDFVAPTNALLNAGEISTQGTANEKAPQALPQQAQRGTAQQAEVTPTSIFGFSGRQLEAMQGGKMAGTERFPGIVRSDEEIAQRKQLVERRKAEQQSAVERAAQADPRINALRQAGVEESALLTAEREAKDGDDSLIRDLARINSVTLPQAGQASRPQGAQEGAQESGQGVGDDLRTKLQAVERDILAAAPPKFSVGGGDIEGAMRSLKVPKALKEQRKAIKEQMRAAQQPRSDLDAIAERVTEPTHADPGQAPEAATAPVIREALQKSARNTPLDVKQAKVWLLAEIDRAIAAAPTMEEKQARFAKGEGNRRVERANGGAFIDFDKAIGFVTLDVPGDGSFKVLNTKETLQRFRDKAERSPGFRDTPAAGFRPDPPTAGLTKREQDLELADKLKQGRRSEALDDLGNAIEIARLHGANDDPLLERFREIADKDYDAWRAEQDAEGEIAARETGQSATPNSPEPRAEQGQQADTGADTATVKESLTVESKDDAGKGRAKAKPKLEDFGERLEGAKKFMRQQHLDALADDALDIATEPLSKTFPVPNYAKLADEGVPSDALAFIAVARNAIPAKPRVGFKLKRWVEQVKQLRSLAHTVLSGEVTFDKMQATAEGSSAYANVRGLFYTATAIKNIQPDLLPQAAKWRIEARGGYSIFRDLKVSPGQTVYSLENPKGRDAGIYGTDAADVTERAAETIRAAVEAESDRPAERRLTKLAVYSDRYTKDIFIGFKGLNDVVRLKTGFANATDARSYIAENQDALQATIDEMRAGPQDRRPGNRPRQGPPHRDGDATPEMFASMFSFRGVQFGSYVEGDRRQAELNEAYDALMDLADVLAIPPKALSLNGSLGLAFGARGSGNAKAHFEPGNVVINLTKTKGAGSLAHEWLHALDNYLDRQSDGNGKSTGFLSNRNAAGAVRAELFSAWKAVQKAFKRGGFLERAQKYDAARSKPYWSTDIEMAARSFERYILDRIEQRGGENDYLVNVYKEGGAYPTDAEMVEQGITPAYDKLFETIDTRETDKGVALFSRTADTQGTTPEAIWSAVESLVGPLRRRRIVVVQSADVLVEQGILQSRDANGAQAFVKDGKAYFIASNIQPGNERAVFLHEVGAHLGMEKILSPFQRNILLTRIKTWAAQANGSIESRIAQAALRRVEAAGVTGTDADAELIAYTVEEAVKAGINPTTDTAGPIGQWFKTLWSAMRAALEKLGLMSPDKLTAQDVVNLAHGAANVVMSEDAAGGGMHLSRADQIDSPAFKRWFGGSRVVDEQGRPLIVYHGTKADISEFSPSASDTNNMGMYFTALPDYASQYAKSTFRHKDNGSNEGANVLPVYLSVQNPLVIEKFDDGGVWQRFRDAIFKAAAQKRRDEWNEQRMSSMYVSRQRIQELREQGYDGIINKAANEIVVFDPTQVKSATGNSGAFSPSDPRIQFSRAAMPDWLNQMPQATQEAARKAGIWQPHKPLKERLNDIRATALKRVQQGLVDQFAPLKELGDREYVLARLTKSSDAPLEALLLYGKPFLNDAGAIDVNLEKGGLIGGLQKLEGEHDRFFAWMAGNRAEQLKAEGRENLFTDTDITALKDLNQGTMPDGGSRAAKYGAMKMQFNAYSKAVLDIAEKAGIINGADRAIWEKDFYVPFYRAMEDGEYKGPRNASGLVNQYAFKKLKGGTDNLNDLMQNTLRNWSHLLSASLKNQAAAAALKTAEAAGVATPISQKQKGSVSFLGRVKHKIPKGQSYVENGVTLVSDGTAEVETIGEKHYMVDDPFILNAITSLEFAGWNNPAMKMMQKAKHYLTLGVTVSPTFKIRNLIRDQIAAIGQNPMSYNILSNLAQGWKGTDKDSAQYAKMLAGGGLMRFGTFLEDDRAEHMKRLIQSGVSPSTILDTKDKVRAMLGKAWDWWQDVGDRSENIARASIYQQRYDALVKEGKTADEAHLLASFAARDSMDFSLQGQWGSIRFLTQLVPFLGARLQGLYKLGREGVAPSVRLLTGNAEMGDKERAMRFGAVTGAVALASIALLLAYRDDDDWKDREEWDRDANWWFKVGDTAFRIPKPFEIGALGTIAERGMETMLNGMDAESRRIFIERMGAMLTQTFSMNPVPQLFKPAIDLYANTDSFTGRPIETMGMERLSKAQRIGPGTSATAQLLGKATSLVGLSPVQVDHLIDSYFSWLGTHAVMTADFALRPLMGLPDQPARKWPDGYFVLGDFAKDLPSNQSKYLTQFYEQAKQVQEAMADIRYYQSLGQTEKALELSQDNADKVRLYGLYTHAERQISGINKQIRMVQMSKADADAKREQIDRLMQARNQIAKAIEARRVSLQ